MATTSQHAHYWHEADMTPPSGPGHDPTEALAPALPRPQLLADPGQRAHKAELAAALFGAASEPVTIGRFRVIQRLGEGGMGVVYLGHDDDLDRRVAIKLLHVDHDRLPDARARLRREAQALARLSDPHVVQIFEVGEHHGQLFVAMELITGQTLSTWLRSGPARPWREVLALMVAAGQGLAAAHAVGLVHRDFKPGNVMVAADGRPRVLDFGLARAQDDEPRATGESDLAALPASLLASPLTMTGGVLGTPAYMAPEQIHGGRCDARSDQFSFCVALYEALYGQRPFTGANLAELFLAIDRGRIVAPPATTQVPAWLHTIVVRGLARDPAARWPSMPALLHELARDRDGQRRRRRFLAAFAGIGAVTLALAGGLGFTALQARNHAAACAAEGRSITAVWGQGTAADLRRRFADRVTPAALHELDNTLENLASDADIWRRLRTEACEDPVPSTTTLVYMQARVQRCFDEARDDLATAVQVLATSDPDALPDVFDLRTGHPERCRDELWLAGEGTAYPDDPALRRRWQAIRADLVRAEVELRGVHLSTAETRARAAAAAAEAMDAPALTLGALQTLLAAQFAAGRRRQALATFERALVVAARVARGGFSDEGLAAQLLLGGAAGTPREALAPMLKSPAVRTPLATDPHLPAALAGKAPWRATLFSRWWFFAAQFDDHITASARAHAMLGDFASAEEYARNGLLAVAAADQPDPHREIDLLTSLARATLGLGQLARSHTALRRAGELADRTPDLSPARRGFLELAAADLALTRGDLDTAAAALARAERLRDAAAIDDDRHAPALDLTLAALHTRRGDLEAATTSLVRARRQLAASHGVARELWVQGELQRVRLDLAAGHLDAADERLTDAARAHDELVGPDHISQLPLLLLQARLQRARGRQDDALTALERAHRLLADHTVAHHLRGELDDQRARTTRDPAQARALALTAREHYQRSELDLRRELADLDALLATLP